MQERTWQRDCSVHLWVNRNGNELNCYCFLFIYCMSVLERQFSRQRINRAAPSSKGREDETGSLQRCICLGFVQTLSGRMLLRVSLQKHSGHVIFDVTLTSLLCFCQRTAFPPASTAHKPSSDSAQYSVWTLLIFTFTKLCRSEEWFCSLVTVFAFFLWHPIVSVCKKYGFQEQRSKQNEL